MNQLVIMKNRQAVTSSTSIADNFDKRHDHILRDIRDLAKDVPDFGEMFFETTEPDSYGRHRRIYLMNRDGFTLLAMGFTGKKAMEFKLKYIKAFNEMENQLQPKSIEDLIIMQAESMKEVKERIGAVEKKQDDITQILSLNPVEWRKKVNNIINKIAINRGGYGAYQDVRNESYELLESRARCQLSIRLTNRKRKMALEGASKSKIDKTNKMDVIADDERLTEIYLAIVKEMAIKNGVESEAV